MTKFLLASLATYPQSVVTGIKSKWTTAVFILPVIAYLVFLTFERELTEFIIPLFPDEADKSFGFYNDFLHLCFNEMLWLSLFLLLAWILLFQTRTLDGYERLQNIILRKTPVVLTGLILITVIGSLTVAMTTLHTFPNSADEYVYLFQAETLSHGKLVEEGHPLKEFFPFNHIAQKEGIAVGRFPPGWPLLLSVAYMLNLPAHLVNPILAAIAVLIFFSFSKKYYGRSVAVWSALSLVLSAYFIFNAASFFSHTSSLLFTVGFVYCIHLCQEKQSATYSLLAGACLGFIMITRYYNAVLFFVPVFFSLVYLKRWKSLRIFFLVGAGAAPFVLFLMWYNYSITGNAFLPVTMWADETEALGFVKGHTFMRGIEYTIRRVLLFTYWCSPAILILYFFYLIKKVCDKTRRFAHPEDYFFAMLLGGYLFYYHLGGNQYGPRFVFEALPFAIVFVINRAMSSKRAWSLALLGAGMIYAIVKLPYIEKRERQVVEERTDIYQKVKQADITNAVILLSTHTGVIRPMPVTDLTRNFGNYKASVLYAQDRADENKILMEYYENRSFYRYVRDPERVKGDLIRLK